MWRQASLPVSQKGLARHYCRREVIDQLFQDIFSFSKSDISRHEGESTYAYLSSHEVDLNTVAAQKSGVACNTVAYLRPTLSSEAFDGCKGQHDFSRGKDEG